MKERGIHLSKRETVEKKTEAVLAPILEKTGTELVDLEYVKEGSDWILRVTLDKEGGLRIDDCETVSRALGDALDEQDFIDDAYMLEVSSPGLLRPLKKPKDYERNMGREVEIHLYKPREKNKEWVGTLTAFDGETVTIRDGEEEHRFALNEISLIRPYIDFSDL